MVLRDKVICQGCSFMKGQHCSLQFCDLKSQRSSYSAISPSSYWSISLKPFQGTLWKVCSLSKFLFPTSNPPFSLMNLSFYWHFFLPRSPMTSTMLNPMAILTVGSLITQYFLLICQCHNSETWTVGSFTKMLNKYSALPISPHCCHF